MTGNITEEQFKEFCKDFVEKYEGRNFKYLVKSLGKDFDVANTGDIKNKIKFITQPFGSSFWNENESDHALFGYENKLRTMYINCFGFSFNYFYTIEDLYKFFKMDFKETKEPSNISKVTFNIPIETIKEDYVEMISKKHNLIKESIELKIIM